MATNSFSFDVGLRNPNFKPDNSSDSDISSNYSDEDIKKTPQVPIPKKSLPKDLPPETKPTSKSQRPARDSSVSSVSSQISSSSLSTRNRKKRKKKKSSVKSEENFCPTVDPQFASELKTINFPLEKDYDFRLVCDKCLNKQKEGENGFVLRSCSSCAMNQLALKKKSRQNWIKVRKRPSLNDFFSGMYKICADFQVSHPCKVEPCTFAHGEGEQLIWITEFEKKFVLETFIQRLQRQNIMTSQQLAEAKSKNKYIPGLHAQKDVSKQAIQTAPKKSVDSNSSQFSVPKQNSYTKIRSIKLKDTPPSSSEPLPSNNNENFPTFLNTDFVGSKFSTNGFSYCNSVVRPKKELKTLTLDPVLKPISVESWPIFPDENPLKKTHTFQMFCSKCFGQNFKKFPSHTCLKNILAFAEKGTSHWLQVRERKHINFKVNYVLCDSVTGVSNECKNSNKCTFAHNTIEQTLWNADKNKNFDLRKFIFSHTCVEYHILHFSKLYGKSFIFICGNCFRNSGKIIYRNEEELNTCNSSMRHIWNDSKVLFHPPQRTIIKKRTQANGIYYMCFKEHEPNSCHLAHSLIERDVWVLLRDMEITEEEFIELLKNCSNFSTTDNSNGIFIKQCPYRVKAMCYSCYLQGKNMKDAKCGHSKESSGVVYLTIPGHKRIRNLPKTIPKNYNFAICFSMKNNKCQSHVECTFAHSQEEIEVWQWMCYNNIKKVEDILLYQEKLSEEMVAGSSTIFQSSTSTVKDLPVPHYCQFCNMSYCNKIDWENHCASHEHNSNVTCDEEKQWNYREPPWNVMNEKSLRLCKKHSMGLCVYSNSLDMYNLCPFAHRLEELEEWIQRFEWRKLKANMAKNPEVQSYVNHLQEKWFNSLNPSLLMKETLPDVKLEMNGEEQKFSNQKKSHYTWTFTVTSKKCNLKMVALLHDKDRTYFTMSSSRKSETLQIIPGTACYLKDNQWKVKVTFTGKTYGSFNQRIIFDFGKEPWLFRDLLMECGTSYNLNRLQRIRENANSELWAPENREIVFLTRNNSLQKKYKKVANIESVVTQDVITKKLNRHNYVQKMHKLLYLEEFECQQKISGYNFCGKLTLLKIIQIDSTMMKTTEGTLYGELPLTDDLSEDTDVGKMILTSCTSVYIAFLELSNKVYEVEIVMENKQNMKGYCRNKIYLSLSLQCIQELGLHPNTTTKVEVQFQFNRKSFCLMHFALDNLPSVDIVFPDPAKNVFSQNFRSLICRSKFLNQKQLVAVKYILGERAHFICPFILNGAYGTGKTETLAQATMELLDSQPNCKILICTQCNSSGDLYILKHLHEYAEKKNQKKILLRLYYVERNILSVPEKVRQYTLMNDGKNGFRNPVKKDFENVRVVISTLENCYQLIKLQLKGTFTHIFIDEAAQEYECKVLLPLTLATEGTCIVLAGDHHQMGVKIHSIVARQQGLGISIMQRLFDYYANHPINVLNSNSPLHTLLIQNYRSVQEITAFISTCFYGIRHEPSKNSLKAVSGLKPLQFYVVFGLEAYSGSSTSYYNEAEVKQVVDCVHNIYSNWPSDLGPFDPEDICVVSAYRDQVILIRSYLRREQRLFKKIVVEQIGNIPGKEFKVMIISTVRTRNQLDISLEKLENYCDETDEPDFFFNKKLLNTAMTRAKYSIITVGDPFALCAYGKCSTIWRIFLNYCSRFCSVKPAEITYNLVRHEVNQLLSMKEKSSTKQMDIKKQVDLLPEPSKIKKHSTQKPANIKSSQPEIQLSQPAVTPFSMPSHSVNIKSSQPEIQLSQPAVTPFSMPSHSVDIKTTNRDPTTLKILQLNLHEAIPFDYPTSKMDSLFSKNAASSETARIDFSFLSVFAVESSTENPTIGLSVYKTDQHFILGVHWPDLQSVVPDEFYENASTYETVLALMPKQFLPNIPELYFTLDRTINTTSCFMKIDKEGNLEDCVFHQTSIKPHKILPTSEIESHLEHYPKKKLNLLNYLQELTNRWCQLRLGNESLHIKMFLTNCQMCDKLLKEIFIQVHVQIVRFLSKIFPKAIPTAWLSFKEGPKLEHWKKEHIFDAFNSVLLLQPFLQGNICQCNVFCKCLIDYIKKNDLQSSIPPTLGINLNTWQNIVDSINSGHFAEAQQVILEPCYHSRIAMALQKLSDLTILELKFSDNDNATYNPTFDPCIYFCKPGVSFLDLLIQKILVAAIHKLPCPVAIKNIPKVTKTLMKNIKVKEILQKEEFFKSLQGLSNGPIEVQATIMSVTDSDIEIFFPQLVSWSFFIRLDMLGLKSMQSNSLKLQFCQIEANVLTYTSNSQKQAAENQPQKIESSQFTIFIKIEHWQQILGYLRSQDFHNLRNCVQSTNTSATLKQELFLPDDNINREVHYNLEVCPYLNFQASAKIVKDHDGHFGPQVELLHLTPNVSLCMRHRDNPVKCFFPYPLTSLSEYQQRLLTEVYHLAITQHRSIILRKVSLVKADKFWMFTIPLSLLSDYNVSLIPNTDSEEHYIFQPLQNMICIRYSLLAKNIKSTFVFHGCIREAKTSESHVEVAVNVTDDTDLRLSELQKNICNIEILCLKPVHRYMADSILNLTKTNPLARNIASRQLKPVNKSNGIFSALEENEFIIVVTENTSYSLLYLMHWFEDLASVSFIKGTMKKEPIIICTPTENELDIIENELQMKDLLNKFDIVRVAAVHDQSSYKSENGIFLHEKLKLININIQEEMNAYDELFGRSLSSQHIYTSLYSNILSKADIILCTCSTSQRAVIRSVVSIKQMIIFNAHLCSELLAMIPISYYNLQNLSLFCSSETASDTSIVNRILQTCPQTKMIFK